jgi:hypothetical protein
MNTKSLFAVACFALFAAFCPALLAQKKDEPDLTAPGDEHKKLDTLAGSWEVAVTFVIEPGKEGKGKAACESKWALGGRFLHQKYESVFMGQPLIVEQYLGFDRHKRKVVELYMNSMDTGVMHNEGDFSKDGKTITCTGTKLDAATGKDAKIRTVTTVIDKDNYTLEWFMTGPDGKESKVVTLTHKRKK